MSFASTSRRPRSNSTSTSWAKATRNAVRRSRAAAAPARAASARPSSRARRPGPWRPGSQSAGRHRRPRGGCGWLPARLPVRRGETPWNLRMISRRRSFSTLQVDVVQEVERHVGVAHEGGVQDRAHFRRVRATLLECLAVDAGGAVLQQRGDDAIFALGDQRAGHFLADVRPLGDGHHVVLRLFLDDFEDVSLGQRSRTFKHRAGDFDVVHGEAAGRAVQRHVADGDFLGKLDADLRFEVGRRRRRRSRRTAWIRFPSVPADRARNTSVIWRSSSRRFSLEPSLARSSSRAKLLAFAAMPDLPSGRAGN